MADAHNLGFTNKTLKETVDYELKFQRRAVEARIRSIHHRRLDHAHWKRVRNCRLPDRTAREIQSIAATYHVDFLDALSIIVADAVSRINRDRSLEDSIFEAPRSINCTSTLLRDLKSTSRASAAARLAAAQRAHGASSSRRNR